MTIADAIIEELTDAQIAELAERLRPLLSEEAHTLLSPREAAARLDVHSKTLTRAARDGRVPGARRVGHGWRFDPVQLDLLPPTHPTIAPTAPRRTTRAREQSRAVDAIRRPDSA